MSNERLLTSYKAIFFTGVKGSGKTTAAEIMQRELSLVYDERCKICPFVDVPKNILWHLFGITYQELHSTELKDRMLNRWPFDTPRNILLKMADCGILNTWPDIWTHPWRAEARENLKVGHILVPDLRMMQEYNVVRDVKYEWEVGTCIVRIKKTDERVGKHVPERFVNDFPPDHLIMNDGSQEDLLTEVRRVLGCTIDRVVGRQANV